MRVSFKTFGCRTNQVELESIKQHLLLWGFKISEEKPDFIIVNSCCVTQKAEKEVERFIRKVLQDDENVIILLTGCLATLKYEEFRREKRIKVFKNSDKHLIYNFLTGDKKDISSFPIYTTSGRTRAFIKVQEGCLMGCSYCIVSTLRNKVESKKAEDVVGEVKRLVDKGVKEIVLCGTRLGSYNDRGKPLSSLVEMILKLPGDFRIRYSSIEPWEITEKLLELSKDRKVCRYFHLPLQSASDKILKLMRRPYTVKDFEKKVEMIRKKIGDVGIYSDVIVGFPSETEEDYSLTERFVKEIRLSGLHVFTFSKRPNTPAFYMEDLPESLKHSRSKRMHEVDKILREEFKRSKIGKELDVLILTRKKEGYVGLSSEFIDVVSRDEVRENEFYRMKAVEIMGDYLLCVRSGNLP